MAMYFDVMYMKLTDTGANKEYKIYSDYDLSRCTGSYASDLNKYINKLISTYDTDIIPYGKSEYYYIILDLKPEKLIIPKSLIDITPEKILDKISDQYRTIDMILKEPNINKKDGYELFNLTNIKDNIAACSNFQKDMPIDKSLSNIQYASGRTAAMTQALFAITFNKKTKEMIKKVNASDKDAESKKEIIKKIKNLKENFDNTVIELSTDLSIFGDATKAFESWSDNPMYGLDAVMSDVERINMEQSYNIYQKIYPKFKVFFREEDADQLLMLGDVYGYDSIVSIDIASERGAASKTAKITLSNVLGNLTNEDTITYENSTYSDLTGNDGLSEQLLSSMNIKAGGTIIIVGGYNSYTYENYSFIGKIVEIIPGPQVQIVAQTFGAELLNVPFKIKPEKLTVLNNYGTYGDYAKAVMDKIPATHFGNIGIKGFAAGISTPYDSKDEEVISRNLLYGEDPISFDNDRDINIFLSKMHFLVKEKVSSYQRNWWVTPDQTTWDVLNELALYQKDYIVTTKPFNTNNYSIMRETVYVGPKNGKYITTDQRMFEYKMLKSTLFDKTINPSNLIMPQLEEDIKDVREGLIAATIDRVNFWAGLDFFDSQWMLFYRHQKATKTENTKIILEEVLMKNTIMNAYMYNDERYGYGDTLPWVYYKDDKLTNKENIANEQVIKGSIANVTKKVVQGHNKLFENVRKTHFLTSSHNIISNNISVNANFYNQVLMQFPTCQPDYDMNRIISTAGPLTYIKKVIAGSGSGLSTQIFSMDDNIKPENVKEYITYQKNIDSSDCEVGANKLRYTIKREIETLMDPQIVYDTEEVRTSLDEMSNSYGSYFPGHGLFDITETPFTQRPRFSPLYKNVNTPLNIVYSLLGTSPESVSIISRVLGGSIGASSGTLGGIPGIIIGGIAGWNTASKILPTPSTKVDLEDLYINTEHGNYPADKYVIKLYILLGGDKNNKNPDISDPLYKKALQLTHVSHIRYPQYYTVGRNILSLQAKQMYAGSITILGDMAIEPGDRIVMLDTTNSMYGLFDAKSVHHQYSVANSFLTTITPELITYINDRRDIFDSQYLLTKCIDIQNTTYNWVGGLGAIGISAATAGIIGFATTKHWGGAVIGGLAGGISSLVAYRSEMKKLVVKEASTVMGRHAIGFMPIMQKGAPMVGGIGGYKRTPYKEIDIQNLIVGGSIGGGM